MRLFTGIDLPEPTARSLEQLLDRLRPLAPLKWSPLNNLHITTRFIGEWPEGRLDELNGALRAMPKPASFPVSIHGLGWYPNPHQPRVFFTGVEGGPELHNLAKATRGALEEIGLEAEERPYSPHITLARIGATASLQAVRQAIATLDSTDFGRFVVDRFHLYLSQPSPTAPGSRYTKLTQFSFAE